MRLLLATKREVEMSERKLLFLMTAEQAEAFARLVDAAEHGDGGAACRLGDMYREGLGGLRYSPQETYRWYSRSALAGDANGQNNLGACYEHGLGCMQSYPKAVKWYRLSAAQQLGTASMNLGYCYLRGKGLPADRREALRLFRLAVEQGESEARKEVERLETGVNRKGITKGPNVRTVDGASVGNIGSVRLPSPESVDKNASAVRYIDATVPGSHLGLVGVAGLPPLATSESIAPDTVRPAGVREVPMKLERVTLGQLLPGFDDTIVSESYLADLEAGFEKFRERTNGKRYIVTTFRSSIDIDAFPSDSISIGEAFAREEDATAEAVRIHDRICDEFLADVASPSSAKWEVVGDHRPPAYEPTAAPREPRSSARVVKSCVTKLKRSWFDIEYVSVVAFELPCGEDPVIAVLAVSHFRPYRQELLSWFAQEGRARYG
jgi:hypothetical protein